MIECILNFFFGTLDVLDAIILLKTCTTAVAKYSTHTSLKMADNISHVHVAVSCKDRQNYSVNIHVTYTTAELN